ncbi:MAG TPA: hypothetical protein DEG17_24915 [Cyanobacteria bacterium UBA11149]|nr:hypothetical protein [Cyanobacteria bacterium UBA11367]HBE58455.1 hypothetical protein [Cyanobacteria bacterium UBA11366]HBK62756.1 hypothetical protein [Cyanobacteria bacterium UBA11166]HBR73482.1 hypothetical protein [Cyanobacteria bacterium UBA11159]HBS71815.1 hypothetical protein [Cyanobacteria bacterium UBA11153]HBW92021.1 hypothetical protein [Cyanobacteria bacterium UBA11149]HCA94257.1 hypothetical protein [Cyanobacteria bacterium UBA9226]
MSWRTRFSEAWPFSEGLAVVAVFENNKSSYGYIDSQGNIAIPPKFDEPSSFRGGLAEVRIRDSKNIDRYTNWGYIDKTGKFVCNLFD